MTKLQNMVLMIFALSAPIGLTFTAIDRSKISAVDANQIVVRAKRVRKLLSAVKECLELKKAGKKLPLKCERFKDSRLLGPALRNAQFYLNTALNTLPRESHKK